jgi:hypothetical protein
MVSCHNQSPSLRIQAFDGVDSIHSQQLTTLVNHEHLNISHVIDSCLWMGCPANLPHRAANHTHNVLAAVMLGVSREFAQICWFYEDNTLDLGGR